MKKTKWAHLLEDDPTFRRWYDNLSRGSKSTAQDRARVLYRFLVKHDMTPTSLVEMGKEDVEMVENLLLDFVSELHREGKVPGYINNYIVTVKSWLRFNRIVLVRKIKVGNTNLTPTIEDERIPTPDELLQILSYAESRGKCSIALMAFSGLRPQVLGHMNGTDGLKIKDFPELDIQGKNVTFTKKPTMINIRANLSKAKHKYFTFLSEEGCDYIKAHLERRLAMGEQLHHNSAIINVKHGREQTGFRKNTVNSFGHIATQSVAVEIRRAMRPRFDWRPYVLRCYFDTQLLIAENNGKISHAYRQFFMGHVGNIEARYTTNKGRLPDNLIEDMRRRYADSEEYFTTRKTQDNEKLRKRDFLLTAETLFPDKIDSIRNILKRHISLEEASPEIRELVKPTRKVRREAVVVESEEEMVKLVSQGWDLDKSLNNGKFLLTRD